MDYENSKNETRAQRSHKELLVPDTDEQLSIFDNLDTVKPVGDSAENLINKSSQLFAKDSFYVKIVPLKAIQNYFSL